MKPTTLLAALFTAVLIPFASGCKSQGVDLGYDAGTPLTADEIAFILANAEAQAAEEPSLLRVN
ncbi:MAG: hypothetical protein AAF711_18100, partial [Planctomycetota bacterium]